MHWQNYSGSDPGEEGTRCLRWGKMKKSFPMKSSPPMAGSIVCARGGSVNTLDRIE